MKNHCVFSDDRKYRYTLQCPLFDDVKERDPNVLFICLNPSTADEVNDDPTVRKCKAFARLWNYRNMVLVNIFAYRATDPRKLYGVNDPVGRQNDFWIKQCAQCADQIVVAWGNHGGLHCRGEAVDKLLTGFPLWCFNKNKNGSPSHPLYMPYDEALVLFK